MATSQNNTRLSLDHPRSRKVTTEIVEVTPEIAREWLAHNDQNRSLRAGVVAKYARDMVAGNWQPTGQSISFDWNDRLIDGQHRLHAVIKANVTVTMLVVWNLDPDAQTVIDTGARRTPGDALKFSGVDGNTPGLAAAVQVLHDYLSGNFQNTAHKPNVRLTNTEVIDAVQRHAKLPYSVQFGYRIYKGIGATPRTIAVAHYLFSQLDAGRATEFFTSIAEMRTAGKGDPRVALKHALTALAGKSANSYPGVHLSLIFRAWNAWLAGQSVTSLPVLTSKANGTGFVAVPKIRKAVSA